MGTGMLRDSLILVALAVASALIVVADRWSGTAFSLAHFYLVPIMLGAWYAGRTVGILLALLSVIEALVMARFHMTPQQLVGIYWTMLTRLVVYLPLAVIVARLRLALTREIQLARTDPLTGAVNGRTFYESAATEVSRASRTGSPLTVAYLDLDNFKAINDQFGHLTGDTVLKMVVETMERNTRGHDVVGRLGGDEFGILMPDTGEAGAIAGMRKLQETINAQLVEKRWPTSISVGIVTYMTPPEDVTEMMKRADELLYEAKRNGKDRVEHRSVDRSG